MGSVLQMKKDYPPINPDDRFILENQMLSVMLGGFDEIVFRTWEWLKTERAREAFLEQNTRLATFFRTSGINDVWSEIIEARARTGVDTTEYIYAFARKVNMEDHLVPYTATETAALNRLCDYNYELIRNVTVDEVTAIRRQLVQDFANGTYPLRTTLQELQLKPINNWSPEQRARIIARTETARALNVSTLETFRNDGVEFVELVGCDPTCDECAAYQAGSSDYPDGVPIEDALECELPHPNCTGAWVAVRNTDTGMYINDELI